MQPTDDDATVGAGDAVPVWEVGGDAVRREARVRTRTPLADDGACAVCVVGAGIFGLTAAYLLQKSGRSTIVLDDGPIGGGQSARTTAHLATAVDGRFQAIESIHGRDVARLVAGSHVAAIATIEDIVRDERIPCDLRRLDGFLCAANGGASHLRILHDERDAAARAGLEVELVPGAPVAGFDGVPSLRFAAQGRLHPLLYLAGLAEGFERAGGRIHTGTRAESMQGGRPACAPRPARRSPATRSWSRPARRSPIASSCTRVRRRT